MGAVYRHKKRGGHYEVLGVGKFQHEGPSDDAVIVIYQGEDGGLWARPFSEFHDGRFELVEPALEGAATLTNDGGDNP